MANLNKKKKKKSKRSSAQAGLNRALVKVDKKTRKKFASGLRRSFGGK